MKVIHIESGLGNQMLSFSEYLLIQKLNKKDKCYIETIIYELPECNETICQWYGFELTDIFDLHPDNIKMLFNEEQWSSIITEIRASQFWKNWNYPSVFVKALNHKNLHLINYRGTVHYKPSKSYIEKICESRPAYFAKRILRPFYVEKYIDKMNVKHKMFIQSDYDIFSGQWLGLRKKKSGIEFIENEIRKAFVFPEIVDEKNKNIAEMIQGCNSVAIHARRGDMLSSNAFCYKYGYFKRSVTHLKNKVPNPVFFFFCDPDSFSWCKENAKIFNLNFEKDKVHFIDWNKGKNSFRDMQLMAMCKHNIITNSSFGWWGSWLNTNPDKITCSPCVWINTTHTF